MLLSFDAIKSFTFGAVNIESSSDGIHFFKCTATQSAAWRAYSPDLGDRSLTTTGIHFDFYTDSKSFAFSGSGEKFDLYINGKMRAHIVPDGEAKEVSFRTELLDEIGNSCDEYRVTLVFPSHRAVGIIKTVEIDDGAYARPYVYSEKMLFIGDSITQGWQSEYDSLSYAQIVSRYFDAESVINGIGGAFFAEDTFEKVDFDPDTVILAYGTNDWGRYREDEVFKSHVCGYLDLVKGAYEGKKIFVISPIWRCDSKTGEPMPARFNERRIFIENEAKARGFFAISGLSMVPPIRDFYADGYLHPNDLGFAIYAQNLIKFIESVK